MRVPEHIKYASDSASSAVQIETTDGYAIEPLVTSRPKVIPLAGIAKDNKAEMNIPSAISFNLTRKDYSLGPH
jgi:hypothetical protein